MANMLSIDALYSLSVWFSNSTYIYLSVSFIQMFKALMPVTIYSISVLFKKESFKNKTMANMLFISFNVAICRLWSTLLSGITPVFIRILSFLGLLLLCFCFEPCRVLAHWKYFGFDHKVCWSGEGLAPNAFSWSAIKDTVTQMNLFGYELVFLGKGRRESNTVLEP
ncbi:probable sugar phosphate/phosphate translocator At5g25400 [Arachis stenosperma]|uniref:probable sugar phosphate/phosphate translocator At5g25400 n=1 Tax=Arachis stenosperma TaxID=217475 RepID=UPI0025ABF3BA|nr:probable sugar phosphate/phosphate translocator At5g25400 [Arachis stenosperma]